MNVSKTVAGRGIVGQCIRLKSPVFLVHESDTTNVYAEVPRLAVAPPGTVLAPFSVESYVSGKTKGSQYATVKRLLGPGLEMRVTSLWIEKSFEGDTLAITARIGGAEEAEISFLFAARGVMDLLDAASDGHSTVARDNLLDRALASFCDAR